VIPTSAVKNKINFFIGVIDLEVLHHVDFPIRPEVVYGSSR